MNILFLDVDGVLNTYGESYRSFKKSESDPLEDMFVRRLEYVLDSVNDLQIVVSSSWNQDRLIERLIKHKFKHINRIIGRTPRAYQGAFDEKTQTYEVHRWARGEQIQAYLDAAKDVMVIDKYLVIDDEVRDIIEKSNPAIPVANVMQIAGNEGLSDLDCMLIIDYFNESDFHLMNEALIMLNKIANTNHKMSEMYNYLGPEINPKMYNKYKYLDKSLNISSTILHITNGIEFNSKLECLEFIKNKRSKNV